MSTMVVFQQMLVILLLIGTGYFLFRKHMMSNCASRDLSCLITMVCNRPSYWPALWTRPPRPPEETFWRRRDCLRILCGSDSAGMDFAADSAGETAGAEFLYPDDSLWKHRFHRNTGGVRGPGYAAAVIYVTIFNLFFNVLIYTHGIAVLEAGNGRKEKTLLLASVPECGNPGGGSGYCDFLVSDSAARRPERTALLMQAGAPHFCPWWFWGRRWRRCPSGSFFPAGECMRSPRCG